MKRRDGFTIIELLVAITVLVGASALFYFQKREIEITSRDATRKTDINAIYHNLEQIYYKENNSYPKEITTKSLPALTEDTLKDPDGVLINEVSEDELFGVSSTYHYEPTDCKKDACTSYTLRAELEKEGEYIKKSRKHSEK